MILATAPQRLFLSAQVSEATQNGGEGGENGTFRITTALICTVHAEDCRRSSHFHQCHHGLHFVIILVIFSSSF